MTKTYDRIFGRESGNFPSTERELKELEEYKLKLKRMLDKIEHK